MDNSFRLDYLTSQLETKPIANTTRARLQQFIQVLQQPIIDLKELKKLSSFGIPDDLKGLRSLVWKLMMGYLPNDRNKWRDVSVKNQGVYDQFCQELIKSKFTQKQINELESLTDDMPKNHKDHPLSTDKTSNWKGFFEDQIIWEEIEKDTVRTRAELSFYVSPTQIQNKYPVYFRTQCRRERRLAKDYEHRHFDVLTRILFIYAKLNPAIRYVQGMNEILAPFYYTLYSDTNDFFLGTVESDAFFCFTMLMADAKDGFLRSMDESQDGIKAKMDRLNMYLRQVDLPVWNNLEKLGIHPQFYSLRWIMLYLTQEFELHSVFRLWDSLLSKRNKNEYLVFLCLGILEEIRDKLLVDDFTDVMESLQRLSEQDIDQILIHANKIYSKYYQ